MNEPPTSVHHDPDPVDLAEYEAELKAQKSSEQFTTLKVAATLLRVIAVVSLLVGLYAAWSVHEAKHDTYAPLTPLVLVGVKEIITSFFIWVAGDVIKILLAIKADGFVLRQR